MGLSIPIIDTIVEKIVEVVIEGLVQGFQILIHYKENLENLKNEMKELEKQRDEIHDKVKQVETEGEVFSDADKSEISTWLNEVGEKEIDIKEFLEAEEDNMKCLRFSCPNYISRGRRSKRAGKKKIDVEKLKTQGENVLSALRPHRRDREFTVTDFIKFESRESAFHDIVEAMKDSKVSMVLVHGVGGVGKTKMVEKVMEKVKEDGCFDEVVMVVVSNNVDEKKIQDDLASALHFKLETDKDRRVSHLKNRLKNGKRNLIILDDVWERLDLKDIGIPGPDETNCCKILMTSRNQEVCRNLQFDRKIQMKVLLEKEAWKFFKMKVGNSIKSDELKNVARAVCDKCAGLPIAIIAVAEALKEKDKNYWEDALEQLRNFMLENIVDINPMVYASLKLSYTSLTQDDQRKCFLLCCLFPEDADIPIDELVKHCMASSLLECKPDTMEKARKRVLSVVGSLKSRCLLLDGTNVGKETVKMHDIIRDVAISLAKNDEAFRVRHGLRNWQEGTSTEVKIRKKHYLAISLRIEDICELPDEVCSEVDTLLLKCSNSSPEISLEKVFSKMKELKILELEGMYVSSLPSSFRNLVNLRMLCLRKCRLENIAMIKVLREKMEILSIQDSKIKALPPEIGQLSGLRVLDLGNCCELEVIPNGIISQLTRLEELYIYGFGKWAKATEANKEACNGSLNELRKLERPTTLHLRIPSLMLWPKDLRFEKLIRFKISLGKYPYPKYEDYSESILELCDCVLKDEIYGLLGKAQTLYLDKVEGLRKVLHDRDGEVFPNLKYFQVSNCGDFQFWLTQIHRRGSFGNLTKLHIRRCKDLEYLCSPSCARVLTQLEDLLVEDCEMMEAIVGTEGEIVEEENLTYFNRLKKMSLLRLPNLTSFFPETKKTSIEGSPSNHARSLFTEKVAFPALEYLSIDGLPNFTHIWDMQDLTSCSIESFSQLREISVNRCDKLIYVFDVDLLMQLQNLKKLNVGYCLNLKVIVSADKANKKDWSLPKLESLKLYDLRTLIGFCNCCEKSGAQVPLFNHQVAFSALEYLSVGGLPNFTYICDMQDLTSRSIESFSQLRKIVVYHCDKLIYVFDVDMLMQLQNLKELNTGYCLNLKVIVSADKANKKDWSLPKLESLQLFSLRNLIGFCNCCEKSGAQVPLFNHQVAFPALEYLSVDGLPNFTHIWNMQDLTSRSIESFSQLRTIDVYRCDKLIYVFDVDMLMQLQIMEKLDVRCCLNLKVIVSAGKANKKDWSLPKLRSLMLCDLENLTGFCNCCEKSGAQVPLFNHQVRFTSLEEIRIEGLPNVTLLWQEQSLSQFQYVRSITIYDCENMGVLISEEGKKEEEEEEDDNGSVIIFPQLWRARFQGLKNFKGLCTIRSRGHQFFNHQVVFPALKYLDIKKVPKITEVLERNIKPRLQCTEQLSVGDIQNIEMIDSENGKDYKENHITLQVEFPKLEVLWADEVKYPILQGFLLYSFEMGENCMVNFQIHYNGKLFHRPKKMYAGGQIAMHTAVDSDLLSFFEIEDILRNYGYDDGDLIYYCMPGVGFEIDFRRQTGVGDA